MIGLFFLLQAATAMPAPWAPVSRTDPATGKTAVSARAMSRDGNAMMTVRCDTSVMPVVSVQVRARTPIDAGDDQPVDIQFDNGAPISARWQFPGGAMLTSNPEVVTALTTGMVHAKAIILATGAGPTAINERWDAPASEDGIKAVLAGCGYELGTVPPPPKKGK